MYLVPAESVLPRVEDLMQIAELPMNVGGKKGEIMIMMTLIAAGGEMMTGIIDAVDNIF